MTSECSCGQLKLYTTGDPVRTAVCHCFACQQRTGSVFGVQARFRKENVTIEGLSKQFVRKADSGNIVTFHFCENCGSTVFWNLDTLPEFTICAVGNFRDPNFQYPSFSVYETRKHSWVEIPDGIEHMD